MKGASPWLRGLDLNQRPLGYEPNELPGCSTPRLFGPEGPSSKKSIVVPRPGIEPGRALGPRDFKSLASASSAISAKIPVHPIGIDLAIKAKSRPRKTSLRQALVERSERSGVIKRNGRIAGCLGIVNEEPGMGLNGSRTLKNGKPSPRALSGSTLPWLVSQEKGRSSHKRRIPFDKN